MRPGGRWLPTYALKVKKTNGRTVYGEMTPFTPSRHETLKISRQRIANSFLCSAGLSRRVNKATRSILRETYSEVGYGTAEHGSSAPARAVAQRLLSAARTLCEQNKKLINESSASQHAYSVDLAVRALHDLNVCTKQKLSKQKKFL
ncbi:hypothetical protein EVAR_63302_1 [Eumeta japonica]|uniref:Uncharacterized protein n=1 Tax=Eumeta variegata TaxID=151549 RepID=A0A4C1ZC02_EUMVA|nr:hypothetical protein EVAR_63302_1 [Eumeta japonica]